MKREVPTKPPTPFSTLAPLLCLFVSLLGIELPAQVALEGQLRMAGGGTPPRPIEVKLELHGMWVDRTVADSSGRFIFSGLGAHSYTLVVDESDFLPVSQVVSIQSLEGGTIRAVITLHPRAGSAQPPPSAEASLPDLLAAIPPKARKEFEAGVKAAERGNPGQAIKHYEKTIELAPAFYPAYNNLGYQYLSQGDLKAAERAFLEVLKLKEADPAACFGLGNVLLQTERHAEAEKTLQQGLEQDPRSALGHYLLGSVHFGTRRFRESEKELRAALLLDPSMSLAQMALVDLYLQQQRDREALQELKLFIERFPDHPMLPQAKQMLGQLEAWLGSQAPR